MYRRTHFCLKREISGLIKIRVSGVGNLCSRNFASTSVNGVVEDLKECPLNLDGNKDVFKSKRMSEIVRALFVFKLCSYNILVRNSLPLMNVSRKVLGTRLYNKCMKASIYGQFVAGETLDDLHTTTTSLQENGLGPMLCVPIEEDAGHDLSHDAIYARNLEMILTCVRLAIQVDREYSMSQTKLTCLVPGQLCSRLSILVPDPYSDAETIGRFVNALDGNQLYIQGMDEAENEEMNKSMERLRQLGELAEDNGVRLLIDAEYTYLNPSLRLISLAMMLRYNRHKPIVSYTYQNYLKGTYNNFITDLAYVRSRGACFAAKLVRGAYLVQERDLAVKYGYEDPVHATFEDTSNMYHRTLGHALDKIEEDPEKYYIIIASHNEVTAKHAVHELKRRNLADQKGPVFFGQLYGMSDYLSTSLGNAGFLVYKSIPYGPIDETIPYLTRRALENSSVLSGTIKERKLLWKSFMARITFRNSD